MAMPNCQSMTDEVAIIASSQYTERRMDRALADDSRRLAQFIG
jgi:hypothetical protein